MPSKNEMKMISSALTPASSLSFYISLQLSKPSSGPSSSPPGVCFGIKDSALSFSCFKSYLSDQHCWIHIDYYQFDLLLVSQGIPHGAVLGPLLFPLYKASMVSTVLPFTQSL